MLVKRDNTPKPVSATRKAKVTPPTIKLFAPKTNTNPPMTF